MLWYFNIKLSLKCWWCRARDLLWIKNSRVFLTKFWACLCQEVLTNLKIYLVGSLNYRDLWILIFEYYFDAGLAFENSMAWSNKKVNRSKYISENLVDKNLQLKPLWRTWSRWKSPKTPIEKDISILKKILVLDSQVTNKVLIIWYHFTTSENLMHISDLSRMPFRSITCINFPQKILAIY